jgi:hypothetical protein
MPFLLGVAALRLCGSLRERLGASYRRSIMHPETGVKQLCPASILANGQGERVKGPHE